MFLFCSTVAGTLAQSGVSAYYWSGAANPISSTLAIGRTGRYVRVQLTSANQFLSLAEVLVPGSAMKLYYAAAGQMIAERVLAGGGNVLYYLHGDHLGSTSATTCGTGCGTAGALLARQLYYPFGQIRYASGTLPTDYGYTGQMLDDTGWMYFRARFYDPELARYTSADTLVPGAGDPQTLNRFAFSLNNPIRYTDPTGHSVCESQHGECEHGEPNLVDSSLYGFGYYPEFGKAAANASTVFAYIAEGASTLGALIESTGAGLGAGIASGLISGLDGPLGFADGAGLITGGAKGFALGHKVHELTTDKVESLFSSLSTVATLFSDVALGNTRWDVYDDHDEFVIGEQTAASAVLTAVGNVNPFGIIDAAIDSIGYNVSAGNLHPYDWFGGIRGKLLSLTSNLGIRAGD